MVNATPVEGAGHTSTSSLGAFMCAEVTHPWSVFMASVSMLPMLGMVPGNGRVVLNPPQRTP